MGEIIVKKIFRKIELKKKRLYEQVVWNHDFGDMKNKSNIKKAEHE